MYSSSNLERFQIDKETGGNNVKQIYLDVFFRKFLKNFQEVISWPVNIEMLISDKRLPIVDGTFKDSYFQGKVTHVSFTNLYSSNKASLQIDEIMFKFY